MYRSYKPTAELQPFVECYWSWEIKPGSEQLDTILPDAAPELIIHLKSRPFALDEEGQWIEQPKAFFYCAAFRALTLSLIESMQVFAIRFRPWGVSRFSSFPVSGMQDRAVLPFEVLETLDDQFVQEIESKNSDTARCSMTDQHLCERLRTSSVIDRQLKMLLEATNGGTSTTAEMAQTLSVSGRSFRRLWSSVVGMEPRKFVQLMRFHQALEKIQEGASLKHVAADCGYSDQAHMARQIKAIAGLSPSLLRQSLGNRVYQDLYAARPEAPWHQTGFDG